MARSEPRTANYEKLLSLRVFFLGFVCLVSLATMVAALPSSGTAAALDTPDGANADALSLLNSRYREPLSIPDANWNDLLALAAKHHADYWAAGGEFGHEETPGEPGFTGVEPWDRCIAVGAPSCGEVAFTIVDIVDAMSGWMGTPYHGDGLISATEIGCGSSSHGSDCDLAGDAAINTPDASAPANASASPVRIWPFNGATDVPIAWTGCESPDPLASYDGDKDNVGPIFFFYVQSSGARATLSQSSGRAIALLKPGDETAAESAPLSKGWDNAFSGEKLRNNTSYALSVRTSDGLTRTVQFKTSPFDNNVSIDVEPQSNGSLSLVISSDAPNPALTLAAGESKFSVRVRKNGDGYLASLASVAPAVYQACASSGGGDSGYQQAKVCEKVTVGIQARRYIKVSKLSVRNRVARVTVRTQNPFVGRRATVDLYVTCPFLGGGLCSGPGLHKAVRLRRAQTISLTVPRRVSRVSLELTIPAGKIGTLPYGSTVIKRKRNLR